MNVKEAKSCAPLWALPALAEHLFDEDYSYIYDIFHQTVTLIKESILKDTLDINKCKKIVSLVYTKDKNTIERYIDFLNNMKNDGCFLYFGALFSFNYDYQIKEATNNMNMISKDSRNWGRMSKFCQSLLTDNNPDK